MRRSHPPPVDSLSSLWSDNRNQTSHEPSSKPSPTRFATGPNERATGTPLDRTRSISDWEGCRSDKGRSSNTACNFLASSVSISHEMGDGRRRYDCHGASRLLDFDGCHPRDRRTLACRTLLVGHPSNRGRSTTVRRPDEYHGARLRDRLGDSHLIREVLLSTTRGPKSEHESRLRAIDPTRPGGGWCGRGRIAATRPDNRYELQPMWQRPAVRGQKMNPLRSLNSLIDDRVDAFHECRRCGTTLSEADDECHCCGSEDIAHHEW